MHNGYKVLDIHGHMSTPPDFRGHVANMVALNTPSKLDLPDERLETALQRHLKVMDERNIDVQIIGPRPVAMWHWMRPFLQDAWCRITNDVIAQSVRLHPDRFIGAAQLPLNRDRDTSFCVKELERCVKELGFVSAYINPDPAGDRETPGLNTEFWWPLYEAAVALDIPLIVHPSASYDKRIEFIPHNYQTNNVVEEYISLLILTHSDVFERFPKLKIVICHCGGALYRFIPTDHHIAQKDLKNNLYYDACCYDVNLLEASIKQKGVDQMMFGSEAPGSGGALRPETGRPSDDMVPVIDSLEFLTAEDKKKIFNSNPKRVFTKWKVD